MTNNTTLRREITESLADGDEFDKLTIRPETVDLDREFDAGFGAAESEPIYAWSDRWVYYIDVHAGRELVDRVPRHPSVEVEPQHHGS